jgi:hypothetical protein|tara:strand:+ start:1913 stop:2128 length:216 start_codon:yes stop_codon:yes gene_type:complete
MQQSKTNWQGRRDLNPQPPVLETGALPIEPLPFEPKRKQKNSKNRFIGRIPVGFDEAARVLDEHSIRNINI